MQDSTRKLEKWISHNGLRGYDPYDFMEWLNKKPSWLRKIRLVEIVFPLGIRKILNIQPKENAKAAGLLFTSYLNLFESTGSIVFKEKAEKCKRWLLENSTHRHKGLSWGYPFDWKTIRLIPKGTPSSVVTAAIGEAFWKEYELTNDKNSLETCKKICEFFTSELKVCRHGKDKISFSYTPIDDFIVHNANLFVAEFLIKVGLEIQNERFVKSGEHAANFTISEQNHDGSIYYWAKSQNKNNPNHIDHYHTGFGLRMLYSISKLTKKKEYKDAFENYYEFYQNNLFTEMGFPKMNPRSKYPINIHSCAEAILCRCYIKEWFEKKKVRHLIRLVEKEMLHKPGEYTYMIRNILGFKIKTNIPYLRWGQAWMLRALTEYELRTQ